VQSICHAPHRLRIVQLCPKKVSGAFRRSIGSSTASRLISQALAGFWTSRWDEASGVSNREPGRLTDFVRAIMSEFSGQKIPATWASHCKVFALRTAPDLLSRRNGLFQKNFGMRNRATAALLLCPWHCFPNSCEFGYSQLAPRDIRILQNCSSHDTRSFCQDWGCPARRRPRFPQEGLRSARPLTQG